MSIFSNFSSERFSSLRSRSWMLFLGLAVLGLSSCNSDDDDELGNWVACSAYEGVARSGAAGFVANDKAYVGTGMNSTNERLTDFWEYDPDKNTWNQTADFPGTGRNLASAFAINNIGYVGLGQDYNNQFLQDFYSYDPTANEWTQVTDYLGAARHSAVSFVINNVAYVGTGYSGNYLNDMYSYNASANTWTKVTSFAGAKRYGAAAMVIDNIAYVLGGNNNGTNQGDVWAYDPTSDTWSEKTDITSDQSTIKRNYASTFVLNGIGYWCMGDNSNAHLWSYNPQTDTWTDVQDIYNSGTKYKVTPGIRSKAVSFVIGTKGYITTGLSGSTPFDDIYSFDPTVVRVLTDD
ncbi:MAG: kelch repeat-containing protein [Siphonobacter sp.]